MISLNQLRDALAANPGNTLRIVLPDGSFVPGHFHITEVGRVTKDSIDCGGTRRSSSACVMQALVAHDVDHRLASDKLGKILALAEEVVPDGLIPVEIEHDLGTVSQFPLDALAVTAGALHLILGTKNAACLDPEKCGLEDAPPPTPRFSRAELLNASRQEACCEPAENR